MLQAELQKQRSILTQCRKDRDCMDGQSGKADDHVAQHEKQLTLPKPVTIKDEAKMAVEHANGLAERSARTSPGLSACAGTLVSSCLSLCPYGSLLSAVHSSSGKHS